MIESYENAFQVIVLLVCVIIAMLLTVIYHRRIWIMLFYFYGAWLMGDAFWLMCLIFYGQVPQITFISDISWLSSYIFLYLLLARAAPLGENRRRYFLPWLGPVFTMCMAFFFMKYGTMILGNLICGIMMGLLLYSSFYRLMDRDRYRNQLFLIICIIIFCVLEYGLWLSSCFWEGNTMANPYYWFDIAMTLLFPFFLPAAKKAVVN